MDPPQPTPVKTRTSRRTKQWATDAIRRSGLRIDQQRLIRDFNKSSLAERQRGVTPARVGGVEHEWGPESAQWFDTAIASGHYTLRPGQAPEVSGYKKRVLEV